MQWRSISARRNVLDRVRADGYCNGVYSEVLRVEELNQVNSVNTQGKWAILSEIGTGFGIPKRATTRLRSPNDMQSTSAWPSTTDGRDSLSRIDLLNRICGSPDKEPDGNMTDYVNVTLFGLLQ